MSIKCNNNIMWNEVYLVLDHTLIRISPNCRGSPYGSAACWTAYARSSYGWNCWSSWPLHPRACATLPTLLPQANHREGTCRINVLNNISIKTIAFVDDIICWYTLHSPNSPPSNKYAEWAEICVFRTCTEWFLIVLFFRIFLRFLTSMRMNLTNCQSVTLLSFRGRLLTWWHLLYKRVRVKVHLGIHIDQFSLFIVAIFLRRDVFGTL